jgi:SpoVK/Ycf46/Vps4 family AAA+-type ATPase
MRPERCHRLVYVLLPDERTYLEIFQIRFHHKSYIKIVHLVELTKNYSGAEIAAACDETGLIPLRHSIATPHIQSFRLVLASGGRNPGRKAHKDKKKPKRKCFKAKITKEKVSHC